MFEGKNQACLGVDLQVLPPQLRLSSTDITATAMWGGTALFGAIWLIQVCCFSFTLAAESLIIPSANLQDNVSP
jgi:hypothetical protein